MLNEDLEPEQEDLLKAMVEASRNVPRDQRGEFHELRTGTEVPSCIRDFQVKRCASPMAISTSSRLRVSFS